MTDQTKRLIVGLLSIAGAVSTGYLLFHERPDAFSIRSEGLKEKRRFLVALPPSYQTHPQTRYPILFLLDGGDRRQFSGDIPLYSRSQAVLKRLFAQGYPELILIGIDNVNRERDMIPIKRPDLAVQSGGSDLFLKFIGQELVPRIESAYRGNGTRILYGESYGGLFVLYVLGTRPDLFDHYLAISPAIGAAPHLIREKVLVLAGANSKRPLSLVMIYGEKDAPMVTDHVDDLYRRMVPVTPPDVRLVSRCLAGEGHNPHASLERGLKLIEDLLRPSGSHGSTSH